MWVILIPWKDIYLDVATSYLKRIAGNKIKDYISKIKYIS